MSSQLTTTGGADVFSLVPKTFNEAMEFSKILAASQLVPTCYRGKPADILVAVQMGQELGIGPTQALAGIAVINGRASIWGDLGKALVSKSGLLLNQETTWDEASHSATVTLWRVGVENPYVGTFSAALASKAGLSGKDTYKTWGRDMITWRAWWRAARDGFSDALKGVASAEESSDILTVESSPSMMPRRISAPEPLPDFSGFNSQPADVAAEPPPEDVQPAAVEGGRMTGILVSVTPHSGETRGKAWEFYALKLNTGEEASTFDKKIRDAAENLLAQPVSIAWEPSPKGGRKALGIDATEPGSDG